MATFQFDLVSPERLLMSEAVDQVDVRGPRFAAWVTTAVLVATLLVSSASLTAAAVILGVQAVVFAIGALGGPRKHPYGLVFAKIVAPRLAPVTEKEPVPPLKFAQLVGFVFAVVVAILLGVVLWQGQNRGRNPVAQRCHAVGVGVDHLVQRLDVETGRRSDRIGAHSISGEALEVPLKLVHPRGGCIEAS